MKFQVSSFKFQVSGFRFQVSSSGFRVPSFEFRVSSFEFLILSRSFQFRVPESECHEVSTACGSGWVSEVAPIDS